MSGKPAILSLIDIPWNSALAAYAFAQALALRRTGSAVFIAAPPGSAAEAWAKDNGFPRLNITDRKTTFIFGDVLLVARFIKDNGISAVSAHTGRTQTISLLASLLCGSKPEIIRTKADAARPSAGITFSRVSRIIAASDHIKRGYVAAGISPEKILCIPQPVEIKASSPAEVSGELKIGMLGRLDPVKGHADFISAAAIISKKIPGVKFRIAGYEANITYDSLRAAALAAGLSDKFEFCGKVADASAFMTGCDIGVIASIGSEAVSRALLEWMACAKPVIATSVGGIPDILPKEYLVPPRSPQALAERIIRIALDKTEMFAAAAMNAGIVSEKYSKEIFEAATAGAFSLKR